MRRWWRSRFTEGELVQPAAAIWPHDGHRGGRE
jgi:hypothetical protein